MTPDEYSIIRIFGAKYRITCDAQLNSRFSTKNAGRTSYGGPALIIEVNLVTGYVVMMTMPDIRPFVDLCAARLDYVSSVVSSVVLNGLMSKASMHVNTCILAGFADGILNGFANLMQGVAIMCESAGKRCERKHDNCRGGNLNYLSHFEILQGQSIVLGSYGPALLCPKCNRCKQAPK